MGWAAIATKAVNEGKEKKQQSKEQAVGFAQQNMQQTQQQMSMDYSKIPSFKDFTNFS
ncbi:hypothetical protein AB4259_02685 [Vibrio amylolyticus]|uniref:hypothetical protein n=1 Tax=Vibrio amylolyticus TaxID=2847292 RepID=UPI00354FD152